MLSFFSRRTSVGFGLLLTSSIASATVIDGLPIRSADLLSVQAQLDQLPAQPAGAPLQFAVGTAAGWGTDAGQWEIDGDTAIWRLQVYSANAHSINLALDQLQLPPSAALIFRSVDGSYRHQARTHADVIDGQLWTPVVPGESAVLEVRMAAKDRSEFRIRVAELNHGFLNFWEAGASAKNHDPRLGTSGSCNIDTACPAGTRWQDQIRSVARITVNGRVVCSGQLVNNTGSAATHYFLTADHCGIGPGGDSPASTVFYWNMENPSCGGNPDNTPTTDTSSGARFVSDGTRSDFTLLCLDSTQLSQYDLFLSGWNAGSAPPSDGASIHHPNGDAKKISLYTGEAEAVDNFPIELQSGRTQRVDAWEVSWSEGTTEGGSSGGGLWNFEGQLVGVLSGGAAACNGSTNNGEPDYYGRFNVAWTEGSASQQLRTYLDPGNSGVTSSLGRNSVANIPSCPSTSSSGGGGSSSGSGGGGGSSVGGVFTACGLLAAALLRRRRRLDTVASR